MKIKQDKDYNIGVNIRRFRMENHLTQEQTAAKMQVLGIDISRGTYSQIECGLANVRVSALLALAEIFNVEIAGFFEGIVLQKPENQQ